MMPIELREKNGLGEETPAHEASRSMAERCQKPDHRRVGNWMARRVTRPMALSVTRFALPLGVTAHAATFTAWAVGLAAAVAFGFGGVVGWLVGAAALELWYLLDHVDGQLARYHRTESLDGAALDYLMHHSLNLLVPFGIGWGMADGGRGWILLGLGLGMGLLMLGLMNDVRYKTFIKRLKRLHGELRVVGGGGGRPEPQAAPPKDIVHRLAWLVRKACEGHVVMNTLAVLALVQLVLADHLLILGRVYLAIMAPAAMLLAAWTIVRTLRRQEAEDEFAAWFRLPSDTDLEFRDGWWHVHHTLLHAPKD